MKKLLLVVGLMGLVGCASKPAPVMDSLGYTQIAGGLAKIQRCTESGVISPELSALGKRYVQAEMGKYTYYPNVLADEARRAYALNANISDADCRGIASVIADRRIEIQQHNESVDRSYQQIQNSVNTVPKPVWCNTVGGVTMCN